MSKEKKCVAGCKIFTGGEIRHDKNCPFYPESLTRLCDDMKEKILRLGRLIAMQDSLIGEQIEMLFDLKKAQIKEKKENERLKSLNSDYKFINNGIRKSQEKLKKENRILKDGIKDIIIETNIPHNGFVVSKLKQLLEEKK